jgi:uracil-DNA glycosylase
VVACFPKEAKETDTHEPPKEAISLCAKRLHQFVEIVSPSWIVYVGKIASQNRIQKCDAPSVNIPHPAAMLRLDSSQRKFAVLKAIAVIEAAIDTPF